MPYLNKVYDEKIEEKKNYSSMEIVMGWNPGWESDIEIASSGYAYHLYSDFINASCKQQRTKLPVLRKPGNQSFFQLIKTLLKGGVNGTELWQIPIPAAFCEPISMLQRFVEFAKQPQCLEIAATLSDPYERHIYCASYALTYYGWF